MNHLFSNIKYFLGKESRREDEFYSSLGFSNDELFNLMTGGATLVPEQLILIADSLGRSVDDLIRRNYAAVRDLEHIYKMLVVDVDGVMTDGGMYYSDSGFEIKKYNTKDGLAMMRLEKNGVKTGMLSHGFNRALIKNRAEMLGVSYHYTGQEKKADIIVKWSDKSGIPLNEIAYLGDDINDLDVMKLVGFTAAPADAAPGVKSKVNMLLGAKGGAGCVRELAESLFPRFFM